MPTFTMFIIVAALFLTGCDIRSLPLTPVDPYPADGSHDTALDVVLQWSIRAPQGDDSVIFDIYFGTNPQPPLADTNLAVASYDPGGLLHGTTFFWQIVARHQDGEEASGPVWSFTTVGEAGASTTITGTVERSDGARMIDASENESFQNPSWSPAAREILFTRFRNGYNREPADLLVLNLETLSRRTLVSDGSGNVNLPGSCWNPVTRMVVFSSSREPHDEIYTISASGLPGDETKTTSRSAKAAYEPSFSPDGQQVVFESHWIDVEGSGVITVCPIDGTSSYQELTDPHDDCRQPNWSPAGDLILYQKRSGLQWDIWVMRPDGTGKRQVTSGPGDKTDASFSPDGRWIVYSSDEGGLAYANLFIIPVTGGNSTRITYNSNGYDGAPSWSGDGSTIAFESSSGYPDESPGTSLWVIDVPDH